MDASFALGLADPVFGSQIIFRQILNAMSRPGTVQSLPTDVSGAPDGISPAAAAILLAMCDYETPLFLSDDSDVLSNWLRFYTGAPRTTVPAEAKFSLIRGHDQNPKLDHFNLGDDRYPDMSTTVLIECPALIGGGVIALSGPGIQDTIEIAPSGLRDEFWIEVQENNSLYPRGVDLMFTSGHQLVAVPRSIQILGQA